MAESLRYGGATTGDRRKTLIQREIPVRERGG